MKILRFLLLLSSFFLLKEQSVASPSANHSEFYVAGQVGMFYHPLRTYGEWIEIDPGFYAWRPLGVRMGWRPYMIGRWVWSDYGWYWVSHEPFGWVVFHYGRWYHDDFYGWIWIPDHVWGPAWVEWRYNDSYIGWAPLPPYARFSVTVGIRYITRWYAPVHYWNFVTYRTFASGPVDRHVESAEKTRRLIGSTRSGGRYDVNGDRIINRGVDRGIVERAGRTRIERVEVRESREAGERTSRDGGRERIEINRPDRSSERPAEQFEARRGERRPSLDFNRIERPQPDDQYERNRQRESIEGRNRNNDEGESQRSRSPLRRLARPQEENNEDEQPRLLPREGRSPQPRREANPQREERRSIQPSPQREGRSVQPAPAPKRQEQSGGESRRSGGTRKRD